MCVTYSILIALFLCTVPAKILSFGGTVTTPWMKEVRLPCSSVGEPAPTIKWTKDRSELILYRLYVSVMTDSAACERKITWMRLTSVTCLYCVSEDSAIPVTADSQRQILSNGTLVLRSVKAEDSGYYTCTATNTLGFDTIIVNLVVQGKTKQKMHLSDQCVCFVPILLLSYCRCVFVQFPPISLV